MRWSCSKGNPVRRHQPWEAGHVVFDSVLRRKARHPGRIELAASGHFRHRVEELLKTCRRDDLEDACGPIPCIPKRVPLATRLEDQVANLAIYALAAKVSAHSTLEDKAVLVLAAVPVHRGGQCVRLHRVLDQCKGAS